MADNRVLKGTLIIAAASVISRILGVLRDVLLAGMVGAGAEKSAYDLAFLVPDLVNHLISTGYLSITFIPIFSGFITRGDETRG